MHYGMALSMPMLTRSRNRHLEHTNCRQQCYGRCRNFPHDWRIATGLCSHHCHSSGYDGSITLLLDSYTDGSGEWHGKTTLGHDPNGKTLGILGMGGIGRVRHLVSSDCEA